jgi:hypothetical protein
MHSASCSHGAVYDPDTLKKLGETFDRAWAAIAGNFAGSSCDAARLQLATIILEFAADGDCNFLELKCRAIGAMQLPRAA